jgi:paraquat-inducible protein B
VQAGSVVLYRKFEVGEVISVRPRADAFDIDLHIKPEYRNLLTSNSVFWAEGGAKVQLNGSGLTVQASPLSRALKGAISFDNLSGASASQRKGDKRILYASETAARAVGGQITLHAFDAGKLAAGMPIRYLGIDIGQIQTLELITARNEVQAKAVLYPEYVQTFARSGTRFSVITRKFRQLAWSIWIQSCSRTSTLNPDAVIRAVILSCRKPPLPTLVTSMV